MKILITGGAGFIGSHVAERHIKDRNDEVVVVDDLSTGSFANIDHLQSSGRLTCYVAGVSNCRLMASLIDNCDIIYHFAAVVGVRLVLESPMRVLRSNIRDTELILDLAASKRKRVLIASTSEVYGKQLRVPFREDADLIIGATNRGRWSYACSKAIDEFLAIAYWKERRVPTVVVRLFNTVGPRQTARYGMVLPTFIRQALKGEDLTVFGDGTQRRCFTHVDDCVEALIRLALHPGANGEVYNVGSNHEISILELAKLVKQLTNSRSKIVFVPYEAAYSVEFEDMVRRIPDTNKIKKLIGFEPRVSLVQTVRTIIAAQLAELGLWDEVMRDQRLSTDGAHCRDIWAKQAIAFASTTE